MFSGDFMILAMLLLPFAAAPAVWALQRKNDLLGRALSTAVCAAELVLAALLLLPGGTAAFSWNGFAGLSLSFSANAFTLIFVVLAALLWTLAVPAGASLSREDKNGARLSFFTLLTLGSVVGVFLAADLFTAFVFFEMMSFASFLWVIHDETREAKQAGYLYLAVSVICGMVTLMGLFLLWGQLGTLEYSALSATAAKGQGDLAPLLTAGALAAVGFAAKAGMYPLHIWVPHAYPAAPAPQAALLSGILSKAGVFGVLMISLRLFSGNAAWGNALLVLSLLTMLWGGVTALFSNDFKRTVANSSMSQIGFILFGVAMACLTPETQTALRGTVLHMVNHALMKLILFLIAGVLFARFGTHSLNKLRGAGRGNPVLLVAFLSAALGLSGVPLFSGYISKTLLHESVAAFSAAQTGTAAVFYTAAEWLFLLSGGLTAAYMLKLFVVLFVQKRAKTGDKAVPLSHTMKEALLLPAALVPVFGIATQLYDTMSARAVQALSPAAAAEPVAYFSLESLSGAAISLLLGILLYFLVVRGVMRQKDGTLRAYLSGGRGLTNLFYRPVLLTAIPAVLGAVCAALAALADAVVYFLQKTVFRPLREKGEFAYDSVLWYSVGRVLDFFRVAGNKLLPWKEENTKSYVELAIKYGEASSMRRTMITASLSWGLLLFGIGLVITLLYLLLT